MHPLVAARGTSSGVAAFELDLDACSRARRRAPDYEDLTSFPAVRQDIAVVVPDGVPAARGARASCARPAASCCADAEVFDVYRGAQVGAGRTSLALRLEFRAADRTLTDEDVAPARARRSSPRCASELGGELRG